MLLMPYTAVCPAKLRRLPTTKYLSLKSTIFSVTEAVTTSTFFRHERQLKSGAVLGKMFLTCSAGQTIIARRSRDKDSGILDPCRVQLWYAIRHSAVAGRYYCSTSSGRRENFSQKQVVPKLHIKCLIPDKSSATCFWNYVSGDVALFP